MTLRPDEIISRKFPRKFFGVDPETLQSFLAEVATAYEKASEEIAIAILERAKLKDSLKQAAERIEALEERIVAMRNEFAASGGSLHRAKSAADELILAAETRAEETIARANTAAEETLEAAQRSAAGTLKTAHAQAEEILASAKAGAEETIQAAQARAAEALKAAEAQAGETVAAAKATAEKTLQTARVSASETLRMARVQAEEATAMAKAVQAARKSAADTLLAARKRAKETVQAAERDMAARRAKLQVDADQLTEQTHQKVTEIRRTAEQYVTSLASRVEAFVSQQNALSRRLEALANSHAELVKMVMGLHVEVQNETLPGLTRLLDQLKEPVGDPREVASAQALETPAMVLRPAGKVQTAPRRHETPITPSESKCVITLSPISTYSQAMKFRDALLRLEGVKTAGIQLRYPTSVAFFDVTTERGTLEGINITGLDEFPVEIVEVTTSRMVLRLATGPLPYSRAK